MSATQDSQSHGFSQDLAHAPTTTSFDGNNLLITAPLDQPQQPYSDSTSAYFGNATSSSPHGQQQPQYAPYFQSGPPSMVGTFTNDSGSDFSQHQITATAHAQCPRPGLPQYSHQQLPQPMQQYPHMAQAVQYMPHDGPSSQQSMASMEIARQLAHERLDAFWNTQFAPQASFGNHTALPIERSQSDMGPQTVTQSFGPHQAANSDDGQRPNSSRSMVDFRPMGGWSQRPCTPANQMSESSNHPTPFIPSTPPHQVQSEAVDLTSSVMTSPRGHVGSVGGGDNGSGDNMDFINAATHSNHTSNRNSVDFSCNQSPSKALGASFSQMHFEEAYTQDTQMNDESLEQDSTSEGASPSASDSDEIPNIIERKAGAMTNAELMQHLVEENNPNPKERFKCLFDGCGHYFARPENGKNHIQAHFQDKPFGCLICNKSFTRPHDAKRHSLIHLCKDKFSCPCGFANSRKDALDRHIQRNSCAHLKKENPHLVRSPTKRGRPKKDRPQSIDEGRITKSSPKKVVRKQQRQTAEAAARAMGSPVRSPRRMDPAYAAAQQYAPHGQTAVVNQTISINQTYIPTLQASDTVDQYQPAQQSFTTAQHSFASTQQHSFNNGQHNADHSHSFNDTQHSFDTTQHSFSTEPQHVFANGCNMDLPFREPGSAASDSTFADHISAPMPQLKDNTVMFSQDITHHFTPPASPCNAYSTGFPSPTKRRQSMDEAGHETPPGSPPDLSNSPAASSMGENELPSAAYGGQFAGDDFQLFSTLSAYNKSGNDDFFAGVAE